MMLQWYFLVHYFNEIWKVKWMLGKEASNANSTIRSMVNAMKKKFLKYWRLSYLTICIPVILDPRCKYKFLEFNLKDELEMEGPKCLANVKRTFRDMFNAFFSAHGDSNIGNEQKTQPSPTNDPWTSWSNHVDEQQRHRTKHNELDSYLKEALVSPNTPIDILQWSMVNRRKYPAISRMARDILAIPASTVASESAFSTGSRVISDHRSRLNSETADALICLQDWMRPSAVSGLTTIQQDLIDDEILGVDP